MLQFFRKKDGVAKGLLDSLLNSNAPPTEKQRRKVDLALQNLKSEYQKVCGVEYSSTRPVSEVGKKLHDQINLYRRALSPIRVVGTDTWQAIFELSVLSIEQGHAQLSMLGTVRLVSHVWNDAAINCPTLWRNLPLMDLATIPVSMEPDSIFVASEWALQHHLDRSGSLSISFIFHFCPDKALYTDKEYWIRDIEAREWVRVLAQESRRWNVVEFHITDSVSRPLWDRFSVPGRVPCLSKFTYRRHGYDSRDRKTKGSLEHLDFSVAPKLKDIVFDSLGLNQDASNLSIPGAKTHLLLPWAKLESFNCATQKDTMYPKLLAQGEDSELRVLKYTSNASNTLPMDPTFLPRLTVLSLCFGEDLHGEYISKHLKYLELPSLKELEVYWGRPFDQIDLYSSISFLVQRSGCTLERLATEHKSLSYDFGQFEEFRTLLYQCPSLTHLDIAYLDAAKLGVLIPHRSQSTSPPLPNLRVLTLRSHREQGLMDPTPLLKVFFGRTNPSRKPPNNHLEDVYVKHDDRDLWRNAVVLEQARSGGAGTLQTPFDPELYSVALSWKMGLLSNPPSTTNADATSSANAMGGRLNQALREMSAFDLGGRDTRVLVWLGIPALLHALGREKQGGLLRKRNPVRVQYRERAEEILAKWKPSLLADFRVSPHRYCFSAGTLSRLRFIEKEIKVPFKLDHDDRDEVAVLECDSDGSALDGEEEDWDRILGRGDTDTWASAPKGPTWLPMRDWDFPVKS